MPTIQRNPLSRRAFTSRKPVSTRVSRADKRWLCCSTIPSTRESLASKSPAGVVVCMVTLRVWVVMRTLTLSIGMNITYRLEESKSLVVHQLDSCSFIRFHLILFSVILTTRIQTWMNRIGRMKNVSQKRRYENTGQVGGNGVMWRGGRSFKTGMNRAQG